MNVTEQANVLTEQIRRVCRPQARYRVLWVFGPPRAGKSILCQQVRHRTGWQYVNFTLDPGYLDSLLGKEKTYRPEDFLPALHTWCSACPTEVLIVDEIEPLLGLWTYQHQNTFFKLISRATRLECGVVVVTRLRSAHDMARLVPGLTHLFELTTGGIL